MGGHTPPRPGSFLRFSLALESPFPTHRGPTHRENCRSWGVFTRARPRVRRKFTRLPWGEGRETQDSGSRLLGCLSKSHLHAHLHLGPTEPCSRAP